ncbi:MAG: biotin/lipoyl-containing protein, partial [Candidatus Izemoplasmatales bacterium]|nr:biotin/lipoyl-containing protein [Candidatus Izemoplasmatales bacterium]
MYKFKFADIGEGIHEGKILEYNYKVGDMIKEGETLVIIETDKVNAEIPIPVDGKIVELGPKEGEIVHVGEILAVVDDGTDAPAKETKNDDVEEENDNDEADNDEAGVVGKLEVSDEVIASSEEKNDEESRSKKVLATPVARKLANDLNFDINDIEGTGEHGRVLKTDIEDFKNIKSTKQTESRVEIERPKQKVLEGDRREKISTLRKSVVKAMTLSKQIIPHT